MIGVIIQDSTHSCRRAGGGLSALVAAGFLTEARKAEIVQIMTSTSLAY